MSRAQLTSTDQQNTGGAVAPFVAGKNKIINGDFNIWQRGTSFSNPNGVYTADRWYVGVATAVPTWTISQQAFTAGSAPVAGYESSYYYQAQVTAQNGSTAQIITQRIEDVRTFAGQTVTISFWAKADSNKTMGAVVWGQNFGSGGSGAVETQASSSFSLTSSWQRFTTTVNVPSISGLTVGSSSYVYLQIWLPSTATYTFGLWGVQVERGSVATPFTTASNTLQGELALCQRYYWRNSTTYGYAGNGVGVNSTTVYYQIANPVAMRVAPTVLDWAGLVSNDGTNTPLITALSLTNPSPTSNLLVATSSSAAIVQYRPYILNIVGTPNYIGFGAEL